MSNSSKPLLCVLALGFMLTGCLEKGKGAPRVPVYKTSGKVTFLGNPVIGASVSFSPLDGQPAAVGRTNDAGEYSLTTYAAGDGAAAGNFKVAVMLVDGTSANQGGAAVAHSPNQSGVLPKSSHQTSQSTKSGGHVLPIIYADPLKTPLTAKVDPNGENKFPLDVK